MTQLRSEAPSYIPRNQLLRAQPFVPQAVAQRMLAGRNYVPMAQRGVPYVIPRRRNELNTLTAEINARRRFNMTPSRPNNTVRRRRTALNIANNIRNFNALSRNINRTVRNSTGGKRKNKSRTRRH